MSDTKERTGRKRTAVDKLICGINDVRYAVIEPFLLKLARNKYAHLYCDPAEKPLISVYVPTYNRADLLMERAVKSVLDQTYTNFEFIIIGDCCNDDTAERIAQIKDPRIRFYNRRKRSCGYPQTPEGRWFAGPVMAANRALEMIRGKWIARLDDDDIWTPDHLEVLLNFAQENDYEFVSASYMSERYGEKILVNAGDDNPRIGGTQTWLYRSYLSFFRYNINCWRKDWNKVNDTDIQQRIYDAGVRMGFLDKVVAHIIPRPGERTIGLDAYIEAEKSGITVHG